MREGAQGRATGRHWVVIETGANQAYVFASSWSGHRRQPVYVNRPVCLRQLGGHFRGVVDRLQARPEHRQVGCTRWPASMGADFSSSFVNSIISMLANVRLGDSRLVPPEGHASPAQPSR